MLARPLSAAGDVSRLVAAIAASITSKSAAVSTRDAQQHPLTLLVSLPSFLGA
jgi:hypothetical protein